MKLGSVELFISSLKSESLFWTGNLEEGILSRQSFSQKPISDRIRKLYPLRSENVTWLSAERGCSFFTVMERCSSAYSACVKSACGTLKGRIARSQISSLRASRTASEDEMLVETVMPGKTELSSGSNVHKGAGAQEYTVMVRRFLSQAQTAFTAFEASSSNDLA